MTFSPEFVRHVTAVNDSFAGMPLETALSVLVSAAITLIKNNVKTPAEQLGYAEHTCNMIAEGIHDAKPIARPDACDN